MATDLETRQPITTASTPKRAGRTWSDRIAGALPGAFLAVVFGFFFITKTSEALTATRSMQALLVIAGIVVGWVVLAWLLRRLVRWVWIRSAILCVVAVVIAVVLVRPYYVRHGRQHEARQRPGAGRRPRPPRPRPAIRPRRRRHPSASARAVAGNRPLGKR